MKTLKQSRERRLWKARVEETDLEDELDRLRDKIDVLEKENRDAGGGYKHDPDSIRSYRCVEIPKPKEPEYYRLELEWLLDRL